MPHQTATIFIIVVWALVFDYDDSFAQTLTPEKRLADVLEQYRPPAYGFYEIRGTSPGASDALMRSNLDVFEADPHTGAVTVRATEPDIAVYKSHPSYRVVRLDALERTVQAERARASEREAAGLFHTYSETRGELERCAAARTDSRLRSIGQSVQGRDLPAIQIGSGSKKIVVTGCHHAREWISVEVPLHLTRYLSFAGDLGGTRPSDDERRRVERLLQRLTFIIIPMLNPDGHEFTVDRRGDRLWRKNLRPGDGGALGVDLNRNYAEGWAVGAPGASDNPRDITYRGPAPFSEPETQAVRNLIEGLLADNNLVGVLNFHSFSQLVLHPWGGRPFDPSDATLAPLRAAAERYASRIASESGVEYRPQQASELYLATGASDDWVWATSDGTVPSLTVELRPAAPEHGGFVLAEEEIEPTCRENLAAMLDLFEEWSRGDLHMPTSRAAKTARTDRDYKPFAFKRRNDRALTLERENELLRQLLIRSELANEKLRMRIGE